MGKERSLFFFVIVPYLASFTFFICTLVLEYYKSNSGIEIPFFITLTALTTILAPLITIHLYLDLVIRNRLDETANSLESKLEILRKTIAEQSSQFGDLHHLVERGTLVHKKHADICAKEVFQRALTAERVYNTYIVKESCYQPSTCDDIERMMRQRIKSGSGEWEELVSKFGLERIENVADSIRKQRQLSESHDYPDAALDWAESHFRVFKLAKSEYFPICNYIILSFENPDIHPAEVYFGWGFFGKDDPTTDVFMSADPKVVKYFETYHKHLRQNCFDPYPIRLRPESGK